MGLRSSKLSDNSIRNQGYVDGWANGRADMLESLEAIALHWERETGGGYEKFREGARWLRTAINKARRGETYDGCEKQAPDPWARIAELETEVARRREQLSQAFDAMDGRHIQQPERFTKSPCECGGMVSNSGHAGASHRRGSIHRQNMERKALGLDPV